MKKISAFDLDHTLLNCNSSFKFGIFLYQQKEIPILRVLYLSHLYFLHKIGLLSLINMQQKIFSSLFFNCSSDKFIALAKKFVEKDFVSMGNKPALEILKKAIDEKHTTLILSSSPDFLVKIIAEKLNVDFYEATHYAINDQHCFQNIGYFLVSDDKALAMSMMAEQYGVTLQNTFAYSDSYLDLTFLKSAGHAIAVNPDRKLRKLCKKLQWKVI